MTKKRVRKTASASGSLAVLGMDIVSFSTLHDDDQIQAVERLMQWISEALAFQSITEKAFRWSPAGDGGYLTFTTQDACRKAIDVAFSVVEKTRHPEWRPRNGEALRLRLALHAGTVQEGRELRRASNIWGMGINMAARVLSIAAPNQLLVSKQYHDTYIRGSRDKDFSFSDVHWRTVKHGVQVEVMNADRQGLCLSDGQARARRWQSIGGLWRKTIQEYDFLIQDTLKSGEPVAALAAAKFLLDLEESAPVRKLCDVIGTTSTAGPPVQRHPIFSLMPPDVLYRVIDSATARLVAKDEVICQRGDQADSCFFPVSGTLLVEIPGKKEPISILPGAIIGEFALWIPNITRTASIRAAEEGLLLVLHMKFMHEILAANPTVAQGLAAIVKTRILQNIQQSQRFFPTSEAQRRAEHDGLHLHCEKYPAGTKLDLTTHVYILFCGSVSIILHNGKPLPLVSKGVIGEEVVIGIESPAGSPDGSEAIVNEESICVRLERQGLREMQRDDGLGRSWSALYGVRQYEVQRALGAK